MAGSSDTSSEVFVLVDRQEVAAAQDAGWASTPRRSRLAGLLRPWRRPGALPPCAPAPLPPSHLSAIPILSLPSSSGAPSHAPTVHINPLTAQPLGSQPAAQAVPEAGQHLQAQPLRLYGCGSAELDTYAACTSWLQQLPDPAALRPPSPGSADDSDSLLSGMSVCSTSTSPDGGGGGGGRSGSAASFARLRLPRPYVMSSAGTGRSSSGGSSNSSLLNLLMQQGEPGMGGQQLAGSAAGTAVRTAAAAPPAAPQPAALPGEAGSTANPLLQLQLPPLPQASGQQQQQQQQQQQAALLSWRRHAWHYSERQEPELLRRLLSHSGEQPAGAQPLSPSAGGGGSNGGRGRASRRHLLALIAVLAVMVLLLHALHSHALLHEHQLAGEQQQVQQQEGQLAALQAAVLEAAAAESAGGWREAGEASNGLAAPLAHLPTQALGRRHGPHHRKHASPDTSRLPRLRRRLTLLLFTQRFAVGGAGSGAQGGTAAGTFPTEQHVVYETYEEWEVTLGRK